MVYRIIRYLDYDNCDKDGNPVATFECQGKKVYFLFLKIGKWKTLKTNDKKHHLMKYKSLQKAKKEMENYFLRDISNDKCELCSRKRFCHYVDYDYIEFKLPIV